MPRCVRNFWIEGNVDGRKTDIGAGPRGKGGGFHLCVLMRDGKGISKKHLEINGYAADGYLTLEAVVAVVRTREDADTSYGRSIRLKSRR